MKKILSFILLATTVAANAQHLENGTFDSTWDKCFPWVAGNKIKKQVGTQPQGWTAANIYGVNGTGKSGDLVTETTGRENIGKAAKIQNVWTGIALLGIGSWAPGYLTLGTPWSTSVGTDQKDGGTFGGIDFTYKPDAISFYYKWNKDKEGKASFIGYLWNGTYKQTNVPSNNVTTGSPTKVTMTDRDRNILGKETTYGDKTLKSEGTLVASYEEYIDAAATSWTKKTIEFNYKNEEEPEKLNLIFCSSDYFSTTVTEAANALIIDDVTLVYYKHLSSLKINGVTPKDFVGDVSANNETTVKISATDTEYTEGCVEAIAAGKGATTYGEYNPLTAVYTIVVTAGDESTKTYEIQFKNSYSKKAYTNSLLVKYGNYAPISTNTIYLLSHQKEEKYGFVLKEFNFAGQDMGMIFVKNLTKTQNSDGTITYANNEPDNVYIKGLGETLPVSVTSKIDKNDVMTATITINLGVMGVVTVTYGPQLTINPAQSLETTNSTGITNVVMTRTFKAGWNTYCMPFDYNVADLGTDVKVQEFVSADNNGLNFAAISDGVLKANNPYLVFFPTETVKGTTDKPVYFATTVNSYNPTPVAYGAYTFSGNYTANMNMSGKYGVADINGVQKLRIGGTTATLPAGCAYFTTPSNANGMLIRLDGGNTTGILDVNTGVVVENAAVYNLQGVKVSNNGTANLPAGIYVMGGKKVIVK